MDINPHIRVINGYIRINYLIKQKYAQNRGYWLVEYPAPWNDIDGKSKSEIGTTKNGKKYWKRAGLYRNEQMAKEADALIAFNVGKNGSAGTNHMIKTATENGLKVREIKIIRQLVES